MKATGLVLTSTVMGSVTSLWCDPCALPSRVVIVVAIGLRRVGSAVTVPVGVHRHEVCEACGKGLP